MSAVPNPDPASGHDGEQPLPVGGLPDRVPPARADDDRWDADADLARLLDDIEAGLIEIPPEDEPVPAVTSGAGEADGVDPAGLAAAAGPGGSGFGQGGAADAMPPGPVLAALTERAAADPAGLSDDELLGVVSAARRLRCRAEYLELAGIGEFTRRRSGQYAASVAGSARPGRRDGEFADDELGMELLISRRAAGDRMEFAAALATRLPCTFAGLADGSVDGDKASAVWFYTRFLSDADAAGADRVLAAAAPGLRYDSLARKAARLEMRLDPVAVKARRERARRDGRRVEARREPSGNMCFGGRELGVEEALAAKAFNDGDALALRRAGMAGSLRELRVTALIDRALGRNPLDRVTGPGPAGPPEPRQDEDEDADAGGEQPRADVPDGTGSGPGAPGGPVPAVINLLIPAGTLLGWSAAPGDAGTWGLLDPGDTRTLVQAASQHPATRWCVTVTGADGTAIAHGCARGQHRWTPAPGPSPPGAPGASGPDTSQTARLAALLRELNVTLSPIAAGSCDHRHREDRYTPSRKLKDLVRARTATCPAPGCGAQAVHCDVDHTIAYPGGVTDECNLSPPCRHHHHVKQAPGWKLEQTSPGVMRWVAPSGRAYTTTPTIYDT